MSESVVRLRIWIIILFALAAGMLWSLQFLITQENTLSTIAFLDVGQGDAIYLETPDGVQVLIDGGSSAAVLTELGSVMPWFDRSIDFVVGTHPDTDHIGGLVDVLERYAVAHILTTESLGETQTARAYQTALHAEGAVLHYARRGQVYALGASSTLEVLYPETSTKDMESNTASIVLRYTYGDTSVLLTGDSPKRIEEYLVLTHGEKLSSDVLKVGHHGSRTSTSELFLETVRPRFAVVSVSADNRYGHPHIEVTDLLFNHRVATYSTAEEGRVVFVSDGSEIYKK